MSIEGKTRLGAMAATLLLLCPAARAANPAATPDSACAQLRNKTVPASAMALPTAGAVVTSATSTLVYWLSVLLTILDRLYGYEVGRCCGRRWRRSYPRAGSNPWPPASWCSASATGWRSAPPRTGTEDDWMPAAPTRTPPTPMFGAPLSRSPACGSPPAAIQLPRRGAQARRGDGARRGRRRLAGRRPARTQLTVGSVEEKPYTRRPYPPFMTSTLQQEAARKLRFSSERTMRIAQRLYENGYITYMRTDSTTLSKSAIDAARAQARSSTARSTSTRRAPVHPQGEERAGGARGDPPGGRDLRHARPVARALTTTSSGCTS